MKIVGNIFKTPFEYAKKLCSGSKTSCVSNVINSNPKNIAPKVAAGVYVASAGVYAANAGVFASDKTVEDSAIKQNIENLKNTGLNEKTIQKILACKNYENKPVFNSENLKSLHELATMKDTKFYDYLMKNLDNLKSFSKKVNSKDVKTYKMTIDAGKTLEILKLEHNGNSISINIQSDKDGKYFEKKYTVYPSGYEENNVVVKDGKIIKNEKVIYSKKSGTILRENYSPTNRKKLVSSIKTRFSDKGVVDDKTFKTINQDKNDAIINNLKSIDYKHNAKTTAEILDYSQLTSEVRKSKNPFTGKVETQILELSEVPGVYNSKIIDANGNEKIESYGRKNPDSSVVVEKNYESLDGTKTHYSYKATKGENNVKMYYQITSKDGEVLSTVDRTFNRISPTRAYSSINGHGYSIVKKEESYDVTDLASGKTTNMRFEDLFKNKESSEKPEMIDKLSGDMLLELYNRGYKYSYSNDYLNSGIKLKYKYIEAENDMYSFSHEQGHSKDLIVHSEDLILNPKDIKNDDKTKKIRMKYTITSNPVFRNVFEKEKKAFVEAFPSLQQEHIDYFIDSISHCYGKNGGIGEAIAEMNALFSTGSGTNELAGRQYYLQKHFPKSIAAASKLLNPNGNLFLYNK